MGIRGLLPFLKGRGLLRPINTRFAEVTKCAIDVPIFAHKFMYAERTYAALERRFLQFGEDLRNEHRIEPIFVFDGAKLELKNEERHKRMVARDRQIERLSIKESIAVEALLELGIEMPSERPPIQIVWPTRNEYESLFALLNQNGYTAMKAKFEAEALCAHLTCIGTAEYAITEDTDSLAFGATKTIFKFFDGPVVVSLEETLVTLDLTPQQFTELCCMFGCDFCDNVHKIGPVTAYALLKKHGSWSVAYATMRLQWQAKTRYSADAFDKRLPLAYECLQTRAGEMG